jgi:LytS/YehU family sensor histidine kinase
MLFNTLSNLRVLIGSDPQRAQFMLDRMSAYLRATLSASLASSQSLQTEFARLQDYLELIAIRMGPRLQFQLDLPPELAHHAVPALLLQPLVENSVQHGLEPAVAGGQVTVRAEQQGAQLLLTVEDSGTGFDANSNSNSNSNSSGFGLQQVRERLQATYGDAASLQLAPLPAGGTRACVTLPLAA